MDDYRWNKLIKDIEGDDIEQMVEASEQLQNESDEFDIPRLTDLLEHGDFVVRESVAWALANLGATDALPSLFTAYERGFKEGHDNDGFSTALIELVQLNPETAKARLLELSYSKEPSFCEYAAWLLDFVKPSSPAIAQP